jgi:antitoxin FitA
MPSAAEVLAFCCDAQQDGIMAISITIRNVPEETRDELAARAARSGRSLQEFLRGQLIDLAGRPEPEALMARVRERVERTNTRLDAEQILGFLDAGRRR